MSKLYELGPHCAPDLPSHVDVNALPDEALREVVVKAFRNYFLMMRGATPTANYVLTKSISVPHPESVDAQSFKECRVEQRDLRRCASKHFPEVDEQ